MKLPKVRGRITENADLSKTNWFQVGGSAEILFKPADLEDLQHFLKSKPDCPITILGVGSNIIVRDGGIEGITIKLGRGFTDITYTPLGNNIPSMGIINSMGVLECGAAVLDVNLAQFSANEGLAGLEFMSGIPGTVGGAVAMNGGAYGSETSDFLKKAQMIDLDGNIYEFSNEELGFEYRKCKKMAEKQFIVTKAWFEVEEGDPLKITARIAEIKKEREESQPVRSRTGGSTFKNPPGEKAWELIENAGLRGFSIGDAQVSEKHCNFLINNGNATAEDLENLILEIQKRVEENSGIKLEPEIKIIGQKLG